MAAMALEGVRVLDFTQMMMGPWATQFLGDMGAEVIKVERPGSGEWERGLRAMGELLGGQSPFFLAMNRNKRSLTLNLKHPRAREVVLRLAGTCDLVTENFRPGVMDRLGMGYEDLRAVNPSLVYVAGTGFGPDGPYADRPGQDLLVQSISGLAAYGGRRDDPPTPAGSSIVDASTALLLAFSSMVGLFHRERTGQGQRIDVSLLDTAVALQCQELTAYLNSQRRFERSQAGIGGAGCRRRSVSTAPPTATWPWPWGRSPSSASCSACLSWPATTPPNGPGRSGTRSTDASPPAWPTGPPPSGWPCWPPGTCGARPCRPSTRSSPIPR
jgi:crotonobetainyl-CoA:carnitine CoA-transferase CaiB-like acyl-CoA transferase